MRRPVGVAGTGAAPGAAAHRAGPRDARDAGRPAVPAVGTAVAGAGAGPVSVEAATTLAGADPAASGAPVDGVEIGVPATVAGVAGTATEPGAAAAGRSDGRIASSAPGG